VNLAWCWWNGGRWGRYHAGDGQRCQGWTRADSRRRGRLGRGWGWTLAGRGWWSPGARWSLVGDCVGVGLWWVSQRIPSLFSVGFRALSPSIPSRSWPAWALAAPLDPLVRGGWRGVRRVGAGYSGIHRVKHPQLKVALSVSGYGGYTLVGDGCAWSLIPCTGYGRWIDGVWVRCLD